MVQMFLGDLDRVAIPNSYGAIGPFRCSCRGRAYVRGTTIGVPAIYDDIMENLRVRYVVTYVSQGALRNITPRKVQVRLVDQSIGEPLQIVDASGSPRHGTCHFRSQLHAHRHSRNIE